MVEQAEGRHHPSTDMVSNREAGQLLLAFLTAVILVLAAATIPMGSPLPESAGGAVVTDGSGASEADRAELGKNS
jgi:hypothetical protein